MTSLSEVPITFRIRYKLQCYDYQCHVATKEPESDSVQPLSGSSRPPSFGSHRLIGHCIRFTSILCIALGITTSGFDIAKYLAHHLALLFIFQRINHSNWGWCGDVHFNTNAAIDSPVEGIDVNIKGELLVFNPAKEPLHKPLHMATKYHLLALRSTLKPLNSCQMH